MNTDTNELYRRLNKKQLEELQESSGGKIKQVPEELIEEAEKQLDGKDYVKLDKNLLSPLIHWAKKENKKNKRKIAKKSKIINRR